MFCARSFHDYYEHFSILRSMTDSIHNVVPKSSPTRDEVSCSTHIPLSFLSNRPTSEDTDPYSQRSVCHGPLSGTSSVRPSNFRCTLSSPLPASTNTIVQGPVFYPSSFHGALSGVTESCLACSREYLLWYVRESRLLLIRFYCRGLNALAFIMVSNLRALKQQQLNS